MVKASEVRSYQRYTKVRRDMEAMLNKSIISAAKTGCSKIQIKLFDYDYFEKDVIKQLLREGGYKFYMTTWDDSVIIRW
jgi:hypothetical protein